MAETKTSAFVISAAMHAAALFVFSLIVLISNAVKQEEAPPLRIEMPVLAKLPSEPPPVDPHHDEQLTIPTEVEETTTLEMADARADELPIDLGEEEVDELVEGHPDAIAASEVGENGWNMVIGPGGPASGKSGDFGPFTHRRKHGPGGGPQGIAADAVEAALRWFKKHQSANGQWDVDGYPANCQNPGNRCEPGIEHTGEEGDIACTAYAILCYLGYGYDHKAPSRYRGTVKKGIEYLLHAQKADGLWGQRNYENAIATMAVAEAYAMSQDPLLKAPAQRGVDRILARQTPDPAGGYALGWDYEAPNAARIDASVTGWNVMALKSAAVGGLNTGNSLEGARQWLRRTWQAANPQWKSLGSTEESRFPYTWNATDNTFSIDAVGSPAHDLACVGALCAVFLNHKSGDVMLETMCNYSMKHQLPAAYPCNTYYLYYNSMAMFQAGGDRWRTWGKTVPSMLVAAQRKTSDCYDGSWDYAGTVFPGHQTGRLLSTAYCCLSLEVYWRWDRVL